MRAVLALLVLVLVLVGGGAFYAIRVYDAPGPLATTRTLVVPRGGIDQVAALLTREGVIRDAIALSIAARATRGHGTEHAGELEFPARASLRQVLGVLRTGRPVQHHVTIPEGLTAAQVAVLLDRTDGLDGEAEMPDEGSLLPETYAFERGTARAALLERARAAMNHALEFAWLTRAPGLPLSTARDALILASIVERETARPEERPHIAAVFENRLRAGMRLQSDPTVVYGASGGLGTLDHPLSKSEMEHADPYNTYRNPGLPPGPISMPGVAALQAVAQPQQSDDLYFVADGSGGHVFAQSLEDHQRNVAKWREVERARTPKP